MAGLLRFDRDPLADTGRVDLIADSDDRTRKFVAEHERTIDDEVADATVPEVVNIGSAYTDSGDFHENLTLRGRGDTAILDGQCALARQDARAHRVGEDIGHCNLFSLRVGLLLAQQRATGDDVGGSCIGGGARETRGDAAVDTDRPPLCESRDLVEAGRVGVPCSAGRDEHDENTIDIRDAVAVVVRLQLDPDVGAGGTNGGECVVRGGEQFATDRDVVHPGSGQIIEYPLDFCTDGRFGDRPGRQHDVDIDTRRVHRRENAGQFGGKYTDMSAVRSDDHVDVDSASRVDQDAGAIQPQLRLDGV
ncbi:hypothetical protein GCM10009543_27090 [Leifsonia naganoensis]